jgi:hypothetical protein
MYGMHTAFADMISAKAVWAGNGSCLSCALVGFLEHFVVEGIQAKRQRLFGSSTRSGSDCYGWWDLPSCHNSGCILRLHAASIRAWNSSQFLLTICFDAF